MCIMTRIEISNPILQEAVASGGPVEAIDTATGRTFVLISSEKYQALCRAVAGDYDPREAYPLIDPAMSDDDANDPLLASYQQ